MEEEDGWAEGKRKGRVRVRVCVRSNCEYSTQKGKEGWGRGGGNLEGPLCGVEEETAGQRLDQQTWGRVQRQGYLEYAAASDLLASW